MAVTRVVFASLLLMYGAAAQSGNARIKIEIAPALVTESDFRSGELDRPEVLILHGFLQTRTFPSLCRLEIAVADEMHRFPVSYCRAYVQTPNYFLSYASWDAARLEQPLSTSRSPITLMLGAGERRFDGDWFRRLHDQGIAIHTILIADHLFDLAHEVDLSDVAIQVAGGAGHG